MKICQASLIMGKMKTPKSQMLLHARPMDKFLSLIPFIIFSPSFHFLFTQYSFITLFIFFYCLHCLRTLSYARLALTALS